MPIPNRRFALVATLAGLTLLAGCPGGQDASPYSDSEPHMRTVTDASGAQVQVPDTAERPVVLHYSATQPMLDLGIQPVGHAEVAEQVVPDDYWEILQDVPVVASGPEPELEQIASLEPDLILATNTLEGPVTEQLADIAPVFQFTLGGDDRGDWQHRVEEVATAFGRQDAFEQLRAEFEDRIDQISSDYADIVEGRTVTAIGAWEEGNVQVHGHGSMPGSLLVGVGFDWSAASDAETAREDYPETPVATERLTEVAADADVLFYDTDLAMETNDVLSGLQQDGLYQRLPAVQNAHAHPFRKLTSAGFGDAHYSLDRIEDALQDMA